MKKEQYALFFNISHRIETFSNKCCIQLGESTINLEVQ